MANPRVKAGAIFYNGKRVGTLQGFTYRIKNGSGQELADAGAFNTDGQITTEISADNIVPITGMGVSMIADLINQQNAEITLGLIDGKLHVIDDARPVDVEVTGEIASGKQTAKFNWQGGKPKVTS
jgi:hypothetical protein